MSIAEPVDVVRFFTLSGVKSPGIATLKGGPAACNWDERKGFGLSGSTVVFTGQNVASFSFSIELYNDEDKAGWEKFKKLLVPPKLGSLAKALDIWHPMLAEEGITSAVYVDRTFLDEQSPGVWSTSVNFKQYRRVKMTLAKPEASKQAPQDPVDRQIEELTAQVKSLANG